MGSLVIAIKKLLKRLVPSVGRLRAAVPAAAGLFLVATTVLTASLSAAAPAHAITAPELRA